MKDTAKIKAINSLEVIEWSAGLGELEYVLAARTDENLQVLLAAGFADEEIAHATGDGEMDIDLSTLALNYTSANCWDKDKGFYQEE